MAGPILYSAATRPVLDAAMATIARHTPTDVEIGIPFAAAVQDLNDGTRSVLILTRQGGWAVTARWVERIRRLDSELAEQWNIDPPGRFDFVTWTDGAETHHAERTIESMP